MKKLLSFLLAGLVSAPAVFSSVVAYSPPVGGMTITFTGSTGGIPKLTAFTPALRLPIGSAFIGKSLGVLTGVTATQFSDSSAGWTPSALSQASAPYFVKLTSGAAAGSWWQISTTANTASTVSLLTGGVSPLSLGIQVGDKYEVVPADTLTTMFGSLTGSIEGINTSAADAVRIYDGTGWREYFYKTANGWREGASGFNRGNTVIRPDSGVVFVRKSAGNIGIMMLGAVPSVRERVVIKSSGLTVVGSIFPVSRTVGSLNFQALPGFVGYTGDLAACDKLSFYDGTSWRILQYNSIAGQWREGISNFNRNTLSIPFGTPILLQRGTGASGNPVLLDLDPPYTTL